MSASAMRLLAAVGGAQHELVASAFALFERLDLAAQPLVLARRVAARARAKRAAAAVVLGRAGAVRAAPTPRSASRASSIRRLTRADLVASRSCGARASGRGSPRGACRRAPRPRRRSAATGLPSTQEAGGLAVEAAPLDALERPAPGGASSSDATSQSRDPAEVLAGELEVAGAHERGAGRRRAARCLVPRSTSGRHALARVLRPSRRCRRVSMRTTGCGPEGARAPARTTSAEQADDHQQRDDEPAAHEPDASARPARSSDGRARARRGDRRRRPARRRRPSRRRRSQLAGPSCGSAGARSRPRC